VRQELIEAPIEKIQNVEMRQPRLLHKLIGVSDVVIATASIRGTIVFTAVANGVEIRDKVFEQIQRTRAQHEYEEREELKRRIQSQINPPPSPPDEATPAALDPAPVQSKQSPRRPARQLFGEMFKLRIESNGTITWRKHQFALIRQIWQPALAFLALVVIIVVLTLRGGIPSIVYIDLALGLAIFGTFGWMIWEWLDWQNDIYMVTRDRLIDLELNPLGVTKKSVAAPLVAITNVSYRQPNLWTLILNIGDVVIETAGATGQMVFISVAKPREIANEIMQHVENTRARQLQLQREQQRADLLQWFGAYHSILQDEKIVRPPNVPADSPNPAPSN
jgi:uncharacterized membrane protein YdbT with pleckstrin-like domain